MRFRFRLSLLFGSVFVLSLATVLFSIERIALSNALQQIDQNLTTAVDTVEKLHRQRVLSLQQNLHLLAGDYAFKTVYASRDEPTIRSALFNYQNRLTDAGLLALCDLDGRVLSNTYRANLNDQPFPRMDILDRADESESGETTAFGDLDDTLYQFIVTPLLAPDIEAWIVSGFPVDDQTAGQFSEITGSHVSFVLDSTTHPRLFASSLDIDKQDALARMAVTQLDSGQFQLANETFIGAQIALNKGDSPQVRALVMRSLDAALSPYHKLSRYVLLIFLISICATVISIVMLSNQVTRSLAKLTQGARAISEGKLDTTVEVRGKDEFAQLAHSFNDMVEGLSEKERVRDLLGKVVSPEIAGKLMQGSLELGGEERQVTVLFCDLQGFTRLSETQAPEQLLNALNTFFSGISSIVDAHGGVVDKYIGDAVMALFGAPMDDPDHAGNAVACGIEICARANTLLADLNRGEGKRCSFGVGIHSGTAVAGNVGSTTRLNYTVIGDTVNVASRVESQTRAFNTQLLVTEATVTLCTGKEFRKLGNASLKGRREEIALYTTPE